MAKSKVNFTCSECNENYIRWQGQCTSCENWNTLTEVNASAFGGHHIQKSNVKNINDIKEKNLIRYKTNIASVDLLLGGGILVGSVILLSGEPGVGKSTLLLEIARSGISTLYISGEESSTQIYSRAKRLNVLLDSLDILSTNQWSIIEETLKTQKYKLIFIDSIQTILDTRISAGSIQQIRELTNRLLEFANQNQVSMIITGHITKEGQIAGPKQLEHAVDVVLYFENFHKEDFRILRAIKNRFGSTGEVAIFQMLPSKLKEVLPNENLIQLKEIGGIGSVLFLQVEGSRVIPLEIQVLVTPTNFSNGRRIGDQIEITRIHIVAAILEKFAGIRLSQTDIFVRIKGASLVKDPAIDLALLLAMASSYLNKEIYLAAISGEITLTGKIRSPVKLKQRQETATALGVFHGIWGGSSSSHKQEEKQLYFDEVQQIIKILFK